jgi:hypothetical protein
MRTSPLYLASVLLFAASASGQNMSGSSTIDIDPGTSTVTATCSTEVDATTEGAYNAKVSCTVYDGDGNLLYTQDGNDDGTGYAETTITFTGTPGTTYNVRGHHIAFAYLDYGEYYDQPVVLGWADDPFNFSSFTEDPEDYPDNFFLEGPGPEIQTRQRRLEAADSHAQKHYPKVTININFVNTKSPGDLLSFVQSDFRHCSENLGLQPCPSTGWWFWQLEGSYAVSDDASLWTVVQTYNGSRETGRDYDTNANLQTFDKSYPGFPDGPQSYALQATPGTKIGYWIDGPGRISFPGPDGGLIVSEDLIQNYSVQICSKPMPTVCSSNTWHVHLIVANGALSSTSSADYGTYAY